MSNQVVATRLREAIQDLGISQKKLSTISGIGTASISQYLSGRHAPSVESSQSLSKVLNVSHLWLLGFDVPKYASKTPLLEIDKMTPPLLEILTIYSSLDATCKQKLMEYAHDMLIISKQSSLFSD